MNHLIGFGVCALAGCTNEKFYVITLHRYVKCSNLMLHNKGPLLGERSKRKYCQTVRMGQEGIKLVCLRLGKCHLFR